MGEIDERECVGSSIIKQLTEDEHDNIGEAMVPESARVHRL